METWEEKGKHREGDLLKKTFVNGKTKEPLLANKEIRQLKMSGGNNNEQQARIRKREGGGKEKEGGGNGRGLLVPENNQPAVASFGKERQPLTVVRPTEGMKSDRCQHEYLHEGSGVGETKKSFVARALHFLGKRPSLVEEEKEGLPRSQLSRLEEKERVRQLSALWKTGEKGRKSCL